jgi:dihydroorotase
MSVQKIVIRKPFDAHLHVRDGNIMSTVLPHTTEHFAGAVFMPNLTPPLRTNQEVREYLWRMQSQTGLPADFAARFTLYLTDTTSPSEITTRHSQVAGVKYYPAGATTNSEFGVTDISKVSPVLEVMAETGLPLLIHGEVADNSVDIFDREQVFIDQVLTPLCQSHPTLKIVFEHITTAAAVAFVTNTPNVWATITAHHLLYNRNELLANGLKPHYYCKPILKTEADRLALLEAATSGSYKFFAGTDSAPHTRNKKECDCGCAGCYTAPYAIQFYAEAFEQVTTNPSSLQRQLEQFLSIAGPQFYGLQPAEQTLTLVKKPKGIARGWRPKQEPDIIVPLRAGGKTTWSIKS